VAKLSIKSITEWKEYEGDKIAEVLWEGNKRTKYVVGYDEELGRSDSEYRKSRIMKAEVPWEDTKDY